MIVLWLAPVAISLLLLAAHYLRQGNLLFTVVSLGLLGLTAVRRPWARRALQVVLSLAALEWARTLLVRVDQRLAAGESWERMAVILSAVSLVAVASVALLEWARARAHFDKWPMVASKHDANRSELR